ncbi:nuclear hormone receptor HR96-like [Brevipalpus obovatus]|uniref:nuclear hormone receptor HR96-like n=1 Tax=Brevipalpus obovatus TaxID=246614 RepID=UPI003D9E03E7
MKFRYSAASVMPPKICRACGDVAQGFNFNVVTCESCKAFFRRNAHKKERLQCSFSNNCKIDVKTRRFCQKCRLEKCFAVGMKQEWILTEEQKQKKREKIIENRIKKATFGPTNTNQLSQSSQSSQSRIHYTETSCETQPGMETYQPPQQSILHQPSATLASTTYDCPTNPLISHIDSIYAEVYPVNDYIPSQGVNNLSMGSSNLYYPNNPPYHYEHSHYSASSTNSEAPIEASNRSIKVYQRILETNFTPIFLRDNNLVTGAPLNELETMKLNELAEAFKQIDDPLITQHLDDNLVDLSDLVNLTEIAIRRLIRWCKQIQSFQNLCRDDQIALLKGGVVEMLLIKASINFNPDAGAWEDNHTKCGMPIKVLQKAKGDLYNVQVDFMHNFNSSLRKDENVNLLLTAIVLFSSDRPSLRHPNTVRLEQSSYEYLLRRYLEARCPVDTCHAMTDYLHLMHVLEYLRELNDRFTKLYLELGPEVIGPLLIEILDLPPTNMQISA